MLSASYSTTSPQDRLVDAETDLLAQRSRTANAGATDFLESLRNPEDRTLPAPDTYAEELVRSVSAPTGLTVLYVGPGGEPLAARNDSGDTVDPRETYDRLGLDKAAVDKTLDAKGLQGRLVSGGKPRYVALWPLAGMDGEVQGVMTYNAPQKGLDKALAYLRYGILGAILASVLLAGLASLFLTRQITRPLSETRDAAIRVASGDYAPVRVERDDELGEVARAFNYMTEEVEHYVGEIQEQKSRLEAVLEASPEAVIATDSAERITMANPAAARMLGIRASDHGRSFDEIGAPPGVLQCLREAAETGVAVRELDAGDRTFWAYAAQMNRENETDNAPTSGLSANSGIILAVRDITEHRSLEKARADFISDVSHELRTPLTTIQSAVDLIGRARDRLDPLEHRALELAEGELLRIRGMVEELSTLSQMDSWQYSLEVGPTDLSEVVRGSVEAIQPKAERFGIELHFEPDMGHPCICDSRKLYQVFLNLLDNAVKYSDSGASVYVSIAENLETVGVTVRDTGVGIPKEDLPQLFERFYRVHKDRSRATGGSGLGLAISKHIVEMHGGEISVSSEAGVGSAFEVRLPKAPLPRSVNHAM